MKKKRKESKKPTQSDLEEFFREDFIGHPGPATTIAAHQRRAERSKLLKAGHLAGPDAFALSIGKKKRKK